MRYRMRQLLREARVSRFEEHLFLTGLLSIAAAVVLAIVNGDLGGPARALGALALTVLGLCATSRAVSLYRANVTAALPESVGRTGIRIRPRWISTVTTTLLALVLPAAAAVAMVVLVESGWLVITGALLLGCAGLLASALNRSRDLSYAYPPGPESAVLAVHARRHPRARARRGSGCRGKRLDDAGSHSRDDAAFEAARRVRARGGPGARARSSRAPRCRRYGRVLGAEPGAPGARRDAHVGAEGVEDDFGIGPGGVLVAMGAAIGLPPAFLFGWFSRLSVLGMSRTREFAADAAAAALTGKPSALASALMKLDGERDCLPAADLRQAQARAVLCIVGATAPGSARCSARIPRSRRA